MFSVVIPVFNHALYVSQALQSCLSSSLVDEVLIVDDGSRDSSVVILRDYARRFPHKIRDLTEADRPNNGAAPRLNQLVRSARNRWVSVLNSDDYFANGRFEVLRWAIRKSKAELFFGALAIVDESGNRLGFKTPTCGMHFPWPQRVDPARSLVKNDWLPALINQNLIATTSNMVFTKQLFEEVGGFRDLRYAHDWDFALRAAALERVEYSPQMLTYYRIHPQNTLKEDPWRTREEVIGLFADFFHDFPQFRLENASAPGRSGSLAHALLGNRALTDESPLAVVLPRHEGWKASQRLAEALPYVPYFESANKVPEETHYVYAPSSFKDMLSANDLRNVILSLQLIDYDFVLVSKDLADLPLVGVGELRNQLVVARRFLPGLMSSGTIDQESVGRVAKLLPPTARPVPIGDVFSTLPIGLKGQLLRVGLEAKQPIVRQDSTNSPKIVTSKDHVRPVVFVLPAFLAVGGVEHNTIEIMRQLRDRYDFVVICTERLQAHQGSMHDNALRVVQAIFDLPEILPEDGYLPALRILNRAYKPTLLWICNGSTWQVANAKAMRMLFNDAAIVDQQVYDTEAGWIEHFSDPAVVSADRFIAVNDRIRNAFVDRYNIKQEKIDLIYSCFETERFIPRSASERAAGAAQFGLPTDKPVFAFVGRLTEQKQPLLFLELVRRCQQQGVDCFFAIVGSGHLETACNDFVAEAQLTNVRLLGYCADLASLYSAVDGMIVTSSYEGLPIAMLQALAMGKPVLSTDVGEVRRVLEEYGSGLVVDDVDDIRCLVDGFKSWYSNLDRYRRAAEDASPRVRERFSSQTIASQYVTTFEKAIQQRAARHSLLTRAG